MSLNKFGGRSIGARRSLIPQFEVTSDGNISVENIKICNLKEPTDATDASNKLYVDKQVQIIKEKIDSFQKELGDYLLEQFTLLHDKTQKVTYALEYLNDKLVDLEKAIHNKII